MKIYIASSWSDKDKAQKIAKYYEDMGHIITRKWWEFNSKDPEMKEVYAIEDKKAIKNCELFIMYNGEKIASGSRYAELGMAIMADKMIFIYGNRLDTIFRYFTSYKGKNIRGLNLSGE